LTTLARTSRDILRANRRGADLADKATSLENAERAFRAQFMMTTQRWLRAEDFARIADLLNACGEICSRLRARAAR
jgi:methylphosphotriester-DNA--protein-cysteine methyltransferase